MSVDFVFMLTRDDATVADARAHVPTALEVGVRHIGFKDVGLPFDQLVEVNAAIQAGGATSYIEVVSLDREREVASAEAAVELGVDVLLGGTRPEDVLPVLEGSSIRYCPFPGRVVGHPSVLEGTVEDIAASAAALAAHPGVGGLDLLAYRFDGDVPALMRAVCAAVDVPVIAAGSIDRPERVEAVAAAGCAGFTVGTAALDGVFPTPGEGLAQQLATILAAARGDDQEDRR